MIGVSLSGGGMKCTAHLGALQVLADMNIAPHVLAGSSMGAVIGAVYASRVNLQSAVEELCRIRMANVFVGGMPFPGLNHGNRLLHLLRKWFGQYRVEHLRVPLLIATCDLNRGETHWIDHGNLGDALYATCAFPGWLAPLPLDQRLLADGAITEPLPVSALRAAGARNIIGLRFPPRALRCSQGFFPTARRTLEIVWEMHAQRASAGADVLIESPLAGVNGFWWNESAVRTWIEAGRAAALRAIPALRRLMEDMSASGPMERSVSSQGGMAP